MENESNNNCEGKNRGSKHRKKCQARNSFISNMEGIGINSSFAVRVLLAIHTQKLPIVKQTKQLSSSKKFPYSIIRFLI